MNKFFELIQTQIKEMNGFKKTLTEWGIQKKLYNLHNYGSHVHPFYDNVVFHHFKSILGGRMRQLISGSAPISKEVLDFLRIAFCCQINEGYGQTECGSPAAITWTNDNSSGHVGPPFPTLEMKLVDVPEMKYLTSDVDKDGQPHPRGEVCYRGYNVFKGYFRQKELFREVVDSEGWVHSGDIGTFL